MSAFSGRQGRGARKIRQALKRDQAEARNAAYQARKQAEKEQEQS